MKILIYGINYTPELTGIGKYTGEMGAWLAKKNNSVDVITAMPYYPQWKKAEAYKNKFWLRENIANATIHRCPLYVPQNVTGTSRIIHEFSFLISSSVFWIRAFFKSYDIVITPYPPLIIGFWPWLYKLFHPNAKWVFHIQDLQVDAAKELELIKNKTLLSILTKLELFWLKKADYISSISEGMKKRILSKGVDESRYIMLPNWAETTIITPLTKVQSLRAELNIPIDKKVILYSGNLGEKQGVEMVVDAAIEFKNQPNIVFVIAGAGAAKTKLVQYAISKEANNILFVELQPYTKLAAFLAIADIHLVIQKKSAADLVLPSKLMSILSAGGVALVTTEENTSLHDLIHSNKIGYICEPENLKSFIDCLENILKTDNSELSKNARLYAENHLSIDGILHAFQHNIVNKCLM
jgi:colanic acid biosynthesis glycosyl transferase WcaI